MEERAERTLLRPEPYRPELELLQAALDWELALGLVSEIEIRTELPELVEREDVRVDRVGDAPRRELVRFLFGPVRMGRARRVPESEVERAFVGFLVERSLSLGLLCEEDLAGSAIAHHLAEVLPRVELERLARERLMAAPSSAALTELVVSYASLEVVDRELIQRYVVPQLFDERITEPGLGPELCLSLSLSDIFEDAEYTAVSDSDPLFAAATGAMSRKPSRSSAPPESFVRRPAPGPPRSTCPPSGLTEGLDRAALIETLGSIGRLPPHHDVLSLSMLRGLLTLYWRLSRCFSVEQRLATFRDVFPVDRERRTALIAWVRVLLKDAEASRVWFDDLDHLTAMVERAERAARCVPSASAACTDAQASAGS